MKTSTLTLAILCSATSAVWAVSNPFDTPTIRQSDLAVPAHHAGSNLPAIYPDEFRSIDGSANNPIDSTRGAANTPLLRQTTVDYGDGSGSPAGANQRSGREISNLVFTQEHSVPCAVNVSDYIWQWGHPLGRGASRKSVSVPIFSIGILSAF